MQQCAHSMPIFFLISSTKAHGHEGHWHRYGLLRVSAVCLPSHLPSQIVCSNLQLIDVHNGVARARQQAEAMCFVSNQAMQSRSLQALHRTKSCIICTISQGSKTLADKIVECQFSSIRLSRHMLNQLGGSADLGTCLAS